jgi:sugar-specific transcriptional regulator TrmB
MLEEREIQTLTKLGLTGRQARVFLDLLKCRTQTAKALAAVSKLARQDVYSILDELQELGIVQKQISVPTKFEAVPIQDALIILLNCKIKETSNLKKETKLLVNSFKNQQVKKAEDEDSRLFIIPGGEIFTRTIRKSIKTARTSIDIISSTKNLQQGFFFLIEALEQAMRRDVKIRCIIDKTGEADPQTEALERIIKNVSFEIRTLTNHPNTRFCIYDKKELSIVLSLSKDFGKSPLLLSKCESIVEAYQDYYDMLWPNAISDTQSKKIAIAD